MTVGELGARMSGLELTWWRALYMVEQREGERDAEKMRARSRRG